MKKHFRFNFSNFIFPSKNLNLQKSKSTISNPIQLNTNLIKSQSLKEINEIFETNKQYFNLVNLNTTYKKLVEFTKMYENNANPEIPMELTKQIFKKYDNNLIIEFIKGLNKKTYEYISMNINGSSDARALSNIYFYYNKLPESIINSSKENLNDLLEKNLIPLIEYMNEQEIANVIYTLSKLKSIHHLINLIDFLNKKIMNFSSKALTIIFYSYVICEIQAEKLYFNIDNLTQNVPIQNFSAVDLSQLIYSYSKIRHIIHKPKFFSVFNKEYLKIYDKIGIMGLSTILNSLANYDSNLIDLSFYDKFEVKILENTNKLNDRMLANIIRAYCLFNKGSNEFLEKLEKRCIERSLFMDEKSFSTILYSYCKNFKGSRQFYSSFENNFLKRYKEIEEKKKLNLKNFQFIFYSYIHIKDIYFCGDELKTFFMNFIMENLDNFNLEELGPIAAMYSFFYKDHVEFYNKLRNLLIEKNKNNVLNFEMKSLSEISMSFSINYPLFKEDQELGIILFSSLEKILEIKFDFNEIYKEKIEFVKDLGKTIFSLLKHEKSFEYKHLYEKVGFLIKGIRINNPIILKNVVQEENIQIYFEKSFVKMGISIKEIFDL